jgi:hypothetical protein
MYQEYIWLRSRNLVFKIISNFLFWGWVGLTQGAISNVLHILPIIQGTGLYIWFRGGDLNSFRDIQQLPVSGGGGLTPGVISSVLHILPVTLGIHVSKPAARPAKRIHYFFSEPWMRAQFRGTHP